ncbi:MAG: ATP-binding protein, partial [Acidimicrobiales bacterium]|nr:ATP-binding protein [Acidimicrobiales bacterium]
DTDAFLQSEAEDQFRSAQLLVVSELSTNAIEALSDSSAEFTLRVHGFADRVEIEVCDSGPGFAAALTKPGAGAADPRGRGLHIVRSLVDEMHVDRRSGTTTICCVMFTQRAGSYS